MHRAPSDHDPTGTNAPERDAPRPLSQSDPPPDAATRSRPPLLLVIVIVLLMTGFVVLHLTGVLGPGSH